VTTDLLEIQADNPSEAAMLRAVEVLNRGGLVAVPTDALYAVVADPYNLAAVGRVFHAKGRESVRSLPIVVSDILMAEPMMAEVTQRFRVLARRFWPGPLSMIVPASARLPLKVTGNTGRVSIRQANAPALQKLLQLMDQPLIATSANLSGLSTCRSGIEAFAVMDGRVDLVLDGGESSGAAATTVDLTHDDWRIIREGAIPMEEIAQCLAAL
jgi:L-threonylcarbamoyladenylate synthase